MEKLEKLKVILKNMGSVLIAYSGGVDSTFLLKVSRGVLKNKVLAVTANSPTYPAEELAFAKAMANLLGARLQIINSQELKDKRFVSNSANRCYFCKKALFGRLIAIAKIKKLNYVIDASNLSDKKDYRPGSKAKEELGVRSPLQEAGFTKNDIRRLSKKMGLITWDKPSLACLSSRIPYGIKISYRLLSQINKAENFLRQLGFRQVRLRHYNGLCRIEVFKEDIPVLIAKRSLIVTKLKKIGYNYVTVDLEGYRSGSLNIGVKKT